MMVMMMTNGDDDDDDDEDDDDDDSNLSIFFRFRIQPFLEKKFSKSFDVNYYYYYC